MHLLTVTFESNRALVLFQFVCVTFGLVLLWCSSKILIFEQRSVWIPKCSEALASVGLCSET